MENVDTYINVDVETTGFIPGVHAILSIGATSVKGGVEIGHFYGTMKMFKGAEFDADTLTWWKNRKNQFAEICQTAREPEIVMKEFYDWAILQPSPRTLTANPACYDASLLWFYLYKFSGVPGAVEELFLRHRGLDIRSYIAAVLNVPYSKAERWLLPKSWSEGEEITHNALDDARQQGVELANLMKANSGELELL